MIPVVSLNSCLYLLFSAVYEDSQCEKLKAGFVISHVVDFLLIVQWIAVLICWRKQKNIAVFA